MKLNSSIFRRWTGAALGLALSFSVQAASKANLFPSGLRCEYLVNPLNIGDLSPRLSWIVESAQRGQAQTGYQIQVATSADQLKRNLADLWDSGKIASDETIGVPYAGQPLCSAQRCFWRIKVWDKNDQPSPWSQPAFWGMGLLEASDWEAEWIGYDKPRQVQTPEAPMEGAKWIWFAADPTPNAPKAARVFMTTFLLPVDQKVEKADLWVTADDSFSFNVNGKLAASTESGNEGWKNVQQIDLSPFVKNGENMVTVQVENATESPAGLLAKIIVQISGQKAVQVVTDGKWRATDQPGTNWHTREIGPSEWPACRVIGDYGVQPWGQLSATEVFTPPPVLLRSSLFQVPKPLKRATLFATGLGWFDCYLNGARVSDDRLNPGWTDYNKRVYYRAYDVTPLLKSGRNIMGAVLADGWYSGYIGGGHKREHYGKNPRFRGQLLIEFADGSKTVVSSGANWKAATGPTLAADILMGETYDARLANIAWSVADFNDQAWESVNTGAEVKPLVQPHPGPAVRTVTHLKPVSFKETKPGVYVLDMGQNFAGVVRLKTSGAPGQQITLRYAERLNPDGTIYTTNLRSAKATDVYFCHGKGVELWEPRFTFHGFQYVEVTGLSKAPVEDTITGIALSSDTALAGGFETNDPMLNKLHNNILWTQRANFIDIPTDCPQRDERLGWTGDAQVYVRTATLNTDVQAFFSKWLVDLTDGQRADGQFPMVAPVKVAGDDGGPAWADAGVICPWTIYEVYGDKRLLERQYDSMVRFIDFCKKRSNENLLPPTNYHCFGDWLSIKAETPKDVIYTAYFAGATRLVGRAAEVLGKADDVARFRELYNQIKTSFNKEYVDKKGRIKGNTQACYVLALAFDLVDTTNYAAATQYLVEDIQNRGWHLSTGFIGTKDLMLVLAKTGRINEAYRLLHNDSFPSWGFSIKHGATSIWERWDGWTPEKGFQDPGMNSFAHYSFGAVYQWMVENIGGIRNNGPAYKKIIIAPQPGGRVDNAQVYYQSIRGKIQTTWKQSGSTLVLEVLIPANTTATVIIPAFAPEDVTESGKPIKEVPGIQFVRMEKNRIVLEVPSGLYNFISSHSIY